MANNHCTLCEQVECPRHFHRQADASRRGLLPTGHNLKAKGHNDVPFRVNMQPTMAPLSHRHADHTHARPTSHTTHTETGASSSWPHTHPHTHYTHNGFRTFSTVKSSTSLTQLTPLRTTTQTPGLGGFCIAKPVSSIQTSTQDLCNQVWRTTPFRQKSILTSRLRDNL
jgi:hypothetical protein